MAHEALRDHLLAHSVKRGEFVLKSGRRSDWFIDSKQTTCRPDGMLVVADALTHADLVTVDELRRYFAGQRRLRNLRIGEVLLVAREEVVVRPFGNHAAVV